MRRPTLPVPPVPNITGPITVTFEGKSSPMKHAIGIGELLRRAGEARVRIDEDNGIARITVDGVVYEAPIQPEGRAR